MENSPGRKKRKRDYEKRQQNRWAKRNGPVTARFVDPATLHPANTKVPESTHRSSIEGTATDPSGSSADAGPRT